MNIQNAATATPGRSWPQEDCSRIPLWVYSDEDTYKQELERIFYGPHWIFVGLEAEIPNPGDYKRATIGERSVLLVRDKTGEINVLLNRCTHRGVEICQSKFGNDKKIMCPYHQWTFNLKGDLAGVPFLRGVRGKGGFPSDFDPKQHGLTKLSVETVNGAVFASFDSSVLPLKDYLGADIYRYLQRIFDGRPLKVLGYQRQKIKSNWKLYLENLRDSYHASLLHVFLISFGLYRIDQDGTTIQDERTRAHNVFVSARNKPDDTVGTEDMKSYRHNLTLNDRSVIAATQEYDDEITIQIQCLFPNLVVQQQGNSLQIRYVIPHGPNEFELQWTYFGYESDDEETTMRRIRQSNLTGPSGLVSVDDTEVLEYSQAGIRPSPDALAVVELGGRDTIPPPDKNMVTESPIRGFYDYYRKVMFG